MENTFKRTWKSAVTDPPKEGGRYWCFVEEQNDLGKSHFQWNCNYNENENIWSDNRESFNVIYWTELAPIPEQNSNEELHIVNYLSDLDPNYISDVINISLTDEKIQDDNENSEEACY